jgi:hypothetical protein
MGVSLWRFPSPIVLVVVLVLVLDSLIVAGQERAIPGSFAGVAP